MALSTAKGKYVATWSTIWEVVCFFLKLLFDLIDLNCIFYDAERSSEAPVCDPDQYLLKEGVLA